MTRIDRANLLKRRLKDAGIEGEPDFLNSTLEWAFFSEKSATEALKQRNRLPKVCVDQTKTLHRTILKSRIGDCNEWHEDQS